MGGGTGAGDGGGGIVGIVGKLPAHGDFVRRGQPVAMLASIDRWLDKEFGAIVGTGTPLDHAVDALDGVRGVFGHGGAPVLTTLIASGDAVGRRFPLVATLTGTRAGHHAAEAWCAAAAAALAATRDNGGDADAALAAVATIAPPTATAGDTPATGWWRAGDDGTDGGAADGGAADGGAASDRDADAPAAMNEADDTAALSQHASPPVAANEANGAPGGPADFAPSAMPNPAADEADGDATLPLAKAAPATPAKRWWRPRRADAAPPAAPAIAAPAAAALPTGAAFRALLEARP